ncbi:P-loop containing nucleoside triphosphate hydrolase protein [Apiosordaria backusii]|uniref:P-loop containing nucleoside triphosphate hydrolase protein n=1 Tax=Apiosordaria backusii TaxID=314023 RepID=A0AA40ESX8_9PEZI|nr:P-loop containing nucleoside triphosphate hydrolase protein [Apiosordaria backusii]
MALVVHNNDDFWIKQGARLDNELKPQERTQLYAIKTEDMLSKHVTRLRKQRDALRRDGAWGRLERIMLLLKPVAHAADLLAHGLCFPSQKLWGSLGLIVELISSRTEALDTVLHAYDSLLSSLPRAPTFAAGLQQSPHLKLAILEAYEAYTILSIKSLKLFGRGSWRISWSTFMWMRDRKLLQNHIQKLEVLVRKAKQEAGHALQEYRQEVDSKAIHEAARNTEQLLSILSLKNEGSRSQIRDGGTKFIAPSRNPSFVGRNSRLADIHLRLCPSTHVGEQDGQSLRSVVLCGLGGVGKSQLALEYIYRYKSSFQACFWVTCDSAVKTTEGFSKIARALGLGEVGVAQIIGNVKDWVQNTTDTWLLVFDNVESPADMVDFWPGSGKGAVILTTQDTSWLSQEYITQGFRLDTMDTNEAVDLVVSLFERKSRKISDKDALDIAKETGGLPLAIRQITSYILAEGLTTEKFFKIYHSHRGSKSIDAWNESTTPWYSHTLATFLDVAFAKLGPRAVLILSIISFLDVDKIQQDLLCDWAEIPDDLGEKTVFDGPLE